MILVDTSVWVDHLRRGNATLSNLLLSNRVATQPFVIGELACGHLQKRAEVLGLLQDLPRVPVASDDEVLVFIEQHGLMGKGIGLIDLHLLASVFLQPGTGLFTLDKKLAVIASELGKAYSIY